MAAIPNYTINKISPTEVKIECDGEAITASFNADNTRYEIDGEFWNAWDGFVGKRMSMDDRKAVTLAMTPIVNNKTHSPPYLGCEAPNDDDSITCDYPKRCKTLEKGSLIIYEGKLYQITDTQATDEHKLVTAEPHTPTTKSATKTV